MMIRDSKDSSKEERDAKSNVEEDSGFEPVFVPQGDQTSAAMPINDIENQDE